MNRHGFARITCCSPDVAVGNPRRNVDAVIDMLNHAPVAMSDVVVFPELCITGYTCGDLFNSEVLLEEAAAAVLKLAQHCGQRNQLVIVGAPVPVGNSLFNCAVVVNHTKIVGVVPKQNIPTYKEFYESRWFRGASGTEPKEVHYNSQPVPFGTDLLFRWAAHGVDLTVGVEVCEDLWMPIPPSSYQALAGATVLVNLSASNETVAKNEYRTQLVANQSGRCVAAYAYASAGPSESTTDLVFGGHCLIAENGTVLAESERVGHPAAPVAVGRKHLTQDVDVQKLLTERRQLSSFGEASRHALRYRVVPFTGRGDLIDLMRHVNGRPFVPQDATTLNTRCAEIFGIQCCGLYKRMEAVGWPDVYIGVSGGLDSTLALLVAAKTFRAKGQPMTKIHGLTMPGYGTTAKTRENAVALMTCLGVHQDAIDIRAAALQAFKDMRHDPFGLGLFHSSVELDKYGVESFEHTLSHMDALHPGLKRGDLVFENVQARLRTFYLMSKGFVLGTGDLSELALGWCTYNGDHMSMYNVNCSIPKTLVKFLVDWVAKNECGYDRQEAGTSLDVLAGKPGDDERQYNGLHNCLVSIVATTVSPELLPKGKEGEIVQSTEDVLGPYELHDFYLANFVRNGYGPAKILWLSDHATFSTEYPRELREKTLKTFFRRFFSQQFKRSCVPDGPKVGSVSLSPRGDWRMPSDADVSVWMEGL